MNKRELIKILTIASVMDDNISFAKYLLNELEQCHEVNENFQIKKLAIKLQSMSDSTIHDSYGIKLDLNDSIETIYQKIHAILYLKLIVIDDHLAKLILINYPYDVIELQQKILLLLIKGNNEFNVHSYFVTVADKLLATGLNVNYVSETYDGLITSPYDYARILGYTKIAQYLKDHGAIRKSL